MDEDMDLEETPKKKIQRRSIKSLRLNIQEAKNGRTWLLLPEGFRDQDSGKTYPLPNRRYDLEILSTIIVPFQKQDSGCLYLRRAVRKFKDLQKKRQSATFDLARREIKLQTQATEFNKKVQEQLNAMDKAVEGVKEKAEKAAANMNDLFDLGRQGIEGQMKAHLADEEWKGEKITAAAFRKCFQMVTQTIKGLGIPSEQREKSQVAVMKELAESLKNTKSAVEMAPGSDPEVEN